LKARGITDVEAGVRLVATEGGGWPSSQATPKSTAKELEKYKRYRLAHKEEINPRRNYQRSQQSLDERERAVPENPVIFSE
jgi:hypothetical protein